MTDTTNQQEWTPVRGPTILLSTGRYFSYESPSAMTVQEVAHSLSKLCRFTGHSRTFYSVAQHAVLVSRLIEPAFAWEGLHHDDAESVMGDMNSPLKRLLPEYKVIELRCERAILGGFGIDADSMPPQVKQADLLALRTEQRDLMQSRAVWTDLLGIEPHPAKIIPVPPHVAEQMFIDRHWELSRVRAARSTALGAA